MKAIAIINSQGGSIQGGRRLEDLIRKLALVVTECKVTEYQGHATLLAKESSGYDTIVVCGGDGTIFEVLAGMDLQSQSLAIFPLGTGNSLGRDLGILRFEDALAALKSGKRTTIDLLDVRTLQSNGTKKEFFSAATMGIGYCADTVKLGKRSMKRLREFCYPIAAIAQLFNQRKLTYHVQYNQETAQTKTLSGILINNTRHAGNFCAFRDASPSDSLFDVMELNSGFFRQSLHNISVLSRKYFYEPGLMRRVRSLSITGDSAFDLMIDGEIVGDVIHVEIKLSDSKISCFVNGKARS
jgi:diacylglycerol kinase (ATP)